MNRKVPIAIVLAGMLVAWALYVSMGGTFTLPWGGAHGNPALVRPVAAEDHILGSPAAPVMVVEYCDFTSDYCKGYSQILHELIATDGADGQVAWVYRHFPLHPDQGDAKALAEAAECAAIAGGNDGFWNFLDQLYANQPADPSSFGLLSQNAGLPSQAFANCYADAKDKADTRIASDRKNALLIGADGAPYSVLVAKGRAPQILDGAYPYDQLKQVVEEALGTAP